MKRGIITLLLVLITVFCTIGCSQQQKENNRAAERLSRPIVKVENFNSKGQRVVLDYHQGPKRIISIWQNSIENVLALGAGDRLICALGVPNERHIKEEYRDQYIKIASRSSGKVDTQYIMDVESALNMEPDLIVGWHSTFGPKVLRSTDFWHQRGVDTYIAPSSVSGSKTRTLSNEIQDILNLGKILGREEKAREIVGQMQQEIDFVVEKTKHYPKKPTGMILGRRGKDLYVQGKASLAGDIFLKVNGNLLAPNERTMSLERLIELNPEVIFVSVGENEYDDPQKVVERFTKDRALSTVKAIKNNRVYPVPFFALYAAGVRSLDGIQIMARGLYPELYK